MQKLDKKIWLVLDLWLSFWNHTLESDNHPAMKEANTINQADGPLYGEKKDGSEVESAEAITKWLMKITRWELAF